MIEVIALKHNELKISFKRYKAQRVPTMLRNSLAKRVVRNPRVLAISSFQRGPQRCFSEKHIDNIQPTFENKESNDLNSQKVSFGKQDSAYVTIKREKLESAVNEEDLLIETERADEKVTFEVEENAVEKQVEEDIPWYMRDYNEATSMFPTIGKFEMPEMPVNSPASLEQMVKHMGNKLSLDNIIIMDMTCLEPNDKRAASDFARYMVICSGKSNKHVMKASVLLYKYFKKEHGTIPNIEGLNKETAKMSSKRLKKSIRKEGQSNVNGYYGDAASVPNSWIMIDSKVDDIFVHILTPERREELNLEYLWAPKKDKYKFKRAPKTDAEYNDDIFSGIRYYHTLNRRFSENQIQKQIQQLSHKMKMSSLEATENHPDIIPQIINNNTFQKLSDQEVLKLFNRSSPMTNPFSLENIEGFETLEGQKVAKDLASSITITSGDDQLLAMYSFYDRLFQLDRNLVSPVCLSEIIFKKLQPLKMSDILLLTESFATKKITENDFSDALSEYLSIINDLFKKYSLQGNILDLTNPETQDVFLNVSRALIPKTAGLNLDFVNSELLRLPGQTSEFTSVTESVKPIYISSKYFQLLEVIWTNTEQTYACIKNDSILFDSFLAFKNEMVLNTMVFFARYGYWDDFWKLWKNKKFTWSPNKDGQQVNNSEKNTLFYFIDTRPWAAFLTLCRLTNNESVIEHALRYWTSYYERNNLETDEVIYNAVEKLLRASDPNSKRYPLTRARLSNLAGSKA